MNPNIGRNPFLFPADDTSSDPFSQLTKEEEETLTRKLLKNTMGGLEAVGYALDTPGALLRGLLAGSPGSRKSGRELLTDWGLTKKNNDKKWELADVAGFGADILFDPLTYLTLGAGAATKTGKALKAAGGWDDLTKIAAKKTAAEGGQALGSRGARVATTVGDVLKYADDPIRQRFEESLGRAGMNPLDVANQNVGGLLGYDIPFTNLKGAIGGTGKTSQAIAGGLDYAGNIIAGSAPYRALRAGFSKAVNGAYLKEWQDANVAAGRELASALPEIDMTASTLKQTLGDPVANSGISDSMRYSVENGLTELPLEEVNAQLQKYGLKPLAEKEFESTVQIKSLNDGIKQAIEEQGRYIPDLESAVGTKHLTRNRVTPAVAQSAGEAGYGQKSVVDRTYGYTNRREANLDIRGGTVRVNQFYSDPKLASEYAKIKDPLLRAEYVTKHLPESLDFIEDQMLRKEAEGLPHIAIATQQIQGLQQRMAAISGSQNANPAAMKNLQGSIDLLVKQKEDAVRATVADLKSAPGQAVKKALPPTLADLMMKIDPNAKKTAAVSIRDIRKAATEAGISREEVDKMLDQASKDMWLTLHRHDLRSSKTPEELSDMLDLGRPENFSGKSGEDKLYSAASLRHGAEYPSNIGKFEPSDSFEMAGRQSPLEYAKSLVKKNEELQWKPQGVLDKKIEALAVTNGVSPVAMKAVLADAVSMDKETIETLREQYLNVAEGKFRPETWKKIYAAEDAAQVQDLGLDEMAADFIENGLLPDGSTGDDVLRVLQEFGSSAKATGKDGALRFVNLKQPGALEDLVQRHAADIEDYSKSLENSLDEFDKNILQEWERNSNFAQHVRGADAMYPEYGVGIFAKHTVDDWAQTAKRAAVVVANDKAVHATMADAAKNAPGDGLINVRQMYEDTGYGRPVGPKDPPDVSIAMQRFTEELAKRGKDASHIYVPANYAGEISRMVKVSTESEFAKKYDEFTRVIKAFLLLSPGYNSRNLTSGFAQNMLAGSMDFSPKQFWSTLTDAANLSQGKEAKNLHKIPVVADELKKLGMDVNAENANRWFRDALNSLSGIGTPNDAVGKLSPTSLNYKGQIGLGDIVQDAHTGKLHRAIPKEIPEMPESVAAQVEQLYAAGDDAAAEALIAKYEPGPRGGEVNDIGVEKVRVQRGQQKRRIQSGALGVAFNRPSVDVMFGGATPELRGVTENIVNTVQPIQSIAKGVGSEIVGGVKAIREGMKTGSGWTAFKEGPLNPLNIGGVRGDQTRFAPVKANEELAKSVEVMNRATAMIGWMRQGVNPAEAGARAKFMHVDYDNLSQFEKSYMRRLIPFYGFNKNMATYVAKNLYETPGGGLSQAIQATNAGRSDDTYIPDYVGEGAAIPNPFTSKEGNYITNLGLMHEGPLSMFSIGTGPAASLERTTQKILAQTNPMIKAPLEWATGKSMYTGRDFKDLYQYPIPNTGNKELQMVNQFLMTSPAGRMLTISRKLGDERKSIGEKALNTLTGFSTTDLSGGVERAREMEARKALEEILMSSPRVKNYQRIYVPDDEKPNLTKSERELLGLGKIFDRNARKAAAAKKKKEKKG